MAWNSVEETLGSRNVDLMFWINFKLTLKIGFDALYLGNVVLGGTSQNSSK